MTREQLQEKSLNDLREIAKLQGVKSLTKYRKGELIDIIMNGGRVDAPAQSESAQPEAAAPAAEEKTAAPAPQEMQEQPAAPASTGAACTPARANRRRRAGSI